MKITSVSAIKILLLLFLVFSGLYFARNFLIPFTLGALLATLFLPMCRWLERATPKWLAPILCVLTLLLIFTGIGGILSWQVSELANEAAFIEQRAYELFARAQEYIYTNLGITQTEQNQLLKDQQSAFAGIITSIAGSFTYIFTAVGLMLIYIIMLLYYRVHIYRFILQLSPADKTVEMKRVISNVVSVSQQYLLGLAKMIVCLWIMYSIGFSIAGVKNPLFFAIICGLLEIVPYIGNFTGTTLTLLVAVGQGGGLSLVLGIIITYGIIQFIQGWVLEPLIVGVQVRINSLFTILALIVGELVWGISGMILAIPLIAMFKIVCDHVESLKPYGFLIGEISRRKPLLK
ncbi:MAG TPA: AI-2E family transporter [Bacteroidia bacterium]|jgi:predicted PurR-regulated permease PerM